MYYYINCFGNRVDCPELPSNTYALSGCRDAADAGKLTVHIPSGLTALMDATTNQQICIPEKAGLSFDGRKWHD